MWEFQTLYQQNHGYIYRFVYKSFKNHGDAEDLTADIILKAMRGVTYERGPKVTRFWQPLFMYAGKEEQMAALFPCVHTSGHPTQWRWSALLHLCLLCSASPFWSRCRD